jgi:hypothetical protein
VVNSGNSKNSGYSGSDKINVNINATDEIGVQTKRKYI